MMPGDTIFALSSGFGRAGVAVVRVSGPGAGQAVDSLASRRPAPRRFSFRKIMAPDGEVIDRGVVIWIPGPGTVTGEDMAEFHVHGGAAVVTRLLAELSALPGFRPADAGEFTRRSFEYGRLDLVEVEGLADVLGAETEAQRKLAMRQYLGEASDIYEAWRLGVLSCLAYAEAAVDFVDEGDVAEESLAVLRPQIAALIETLEAARIRAEQASAIRRGLSVVIGGAPNAGKSSLMNALAGHEVSIVSPVAGTTRDVVSDVVVIAGVPVRMVDTAGLRDATEDVIEAEGMRRAADQARSADILVWLEAADGVERVIPPRAPDLVVLSKADLLDGDSIRRRDEAALALSMVSGEGLASLRSAIETEIMKRLSAAEDGTMVRARHVQSVSEALTHLKSALLHDVASLELLAEDVRKAARALASITGRVDVEDVLGRVFSEFCIGK